MKRLEAILPDPVLRQVLVLIAETAEELHVYDVKPPTVSAPLPKPKAKPPKKPTPKPAAAKEPPTNALVRPPAIVQLHEYLAAHGPAAPATLDALGTERGYAVGTFSVTAAKAVHRGLLERTEEGLYRVPATILPASAENQPQDTAGGPAAQDAPSVRYGINS